MVIGRWFQEISRLLPGFGMVIVMPSFQEFGKWCCLRHPLNIDVSCIMSLFGANLRVLLAIWSLPGALRLARALIISVISTGDVKRVD